jgi:ABC-type glycerol-3-phosphate transport system substrate-binding protein
MDENMIFKPIEEQENESGVIPEIPVGQFTSPPQELSSSPPPSIIFKAVKIFIGIAVIIGIIFVVFNFILPRFTPTQFNNITLTYWGASDDPQTVAPIIANFQKQHPNIKVEYVKVDIDQYKDKLITRSKNGNGPDIFLFHNSWVPQISSILLAIPSSTMSQETFIKSYYPVAKRDLVKGGVVYGVPKEIDVLCLYVNKDIFQAAGLSVPTTWVDLVSVAKSLTVKDENGSIRTAGVAMGTTSNVTHAQDILAMLMAQNGVNLTDLGSNPEAVTDALFFYTQIAKVPDNMWDENMDQSIKVFASGSLAMYFGYARDYSIIKAMNSNLVFDIYEVPKLQEQGMTTASYWAEGVSNRSKHQNEALQFLQYLASKEVSQQLFNEQSKTRNIGQPYARIDLAESLNSSIIFPFVTSAPSAISSYFVDGTYDNGLNTQSNEELNKAISSVLGGGSPQVAAEDLSKGITPILKQYGL